MSALKNKIEASDKNINALLKDQKFYMIIFKENTLDKIEMKL
nr:hypothetical protein [uncultured Brumimicrobium sp.]